jgi:hypothetical protein
MKRILTAIAMLGLATGGLSLYAQDMPSSQAPPSTTQQQQVDTQSPATSKSFEGKIAKSGDKLILQESSTGTAYQLDDQDKAKQFEGQSVKMTATLDPNTNTLHVVEIAPMESN